MKLLDLRIERFPGFEKEGFGLGTLQEGVHVIWGPNGSGKSTACRAIRALLWPDEGPFLHPVFLHSQWEWNKEKRMISREGSHRTIPEELAEQLKGAASHAYFFSLDDLFEEKEKDLAKLLSNEMHGGYDLSELWQKFEIPPRFGLLEANQISNLDKDLQKVAREQSRIAEREENLSALQEQIVNSSAANDELEQIECALECTKLKNAMDALAAPTTKRSLLKEIHWSLLLFALAIFIFFLAGYWALLPCAAALFFLKRHFDVRARARDEEADLQNRKTHLEGRLSQEILDLKEKRYLECSIAELEGRGNELASVASNLGALLDKKTEIEREVQIALATMSFDKVCKKIQSAKELFEKKQGEAKRLLLGRALLKRIEEQFEKEQQPIVLKKAAEYFELFSLGACQLHSLSHEVFRIWDAKRERYCKLLELSYGLRVQLLLSLRLGFLFASEKEVLKLPLFMDEVLCHVDDDRFSSVAESIMQIGKERQVFLFTCQRWSFESWKRLGATAIDLEEVQGKQRMHRILSPIVSKPRLAREPNDGEDKISYAHEMGLFSPNLNLKFVDQPSWIVLDSPQEIYHMYSLGVKTVGHLLTLPCKESTREKCSLLKKALELASIGRVAKISRSDLENAVQRDIFSKTFLDTLAMHAKKVEGSAKELLEALKNKEVKRFSAIYTEKLEQYFLEGGFLDLRNPLSEEELREQLYRSLDPLSDENIQFISELVHWFLFSETKK